MNRLSLIIACKRILTEPESFFRGFKGKLVKVAVLGCFGSEGLGTSSWLLSPFKVST